MQYVSEKWLRIFNYYYLFVVSIFLGLYIYHALQQNTLVIDGSNITGSNIAVGIFSFVCIAYNATLLRIIKRTNVWLAYFLSFVLYALASNAATESALVYTSSYIFIANNFILTCAATTLGPIIAIFVLAIVGLMFTMSATGMAPSTIIGVGGDAIMALIRAIVVMLLLFRLKDRYISVNAVKNENYIERYFVKNEVVNLLTDSIVDGVIIIDKHNNIKSINPGALRLLDQKEEDILDLDYKSVLKFQSLNREPIGANNEPIANTLKGQASSSHELIMTVRNNQELFVDLTISPIFNKQTKELYGGVIILRDVSKKKQEEAARSEFISTASHEMRTPVAAIEGYLGLVLNDKVSTLDARARGYLEKAHASTEHLGRLFQDLLLSANAEDGRLISRPQVIEMGQFLERLTETLRFAAEKKNLGMDFTIGASSAEQRDATGSKMIRPLYYTHVDPDRIREAITNLFDNAVKYTESGKVSIGLTGNNEIVQIFVRDTGPGIPANDIGHLFQKFYRVDNSATRTIGGTGLGLFICRKIVELYNGNLWVESELGKGSTFFINLPRLSSQKAEELIRSEAVQEAGVSPLDKTTGVVQ